VNLVGGRLEGQWAVAADGQLTLAGGANAGLKYIGGNAVLTNHGTVHAQDHTRLWNYSQVVNNGTWQLEGDVGVYDTYGGNSLVNNGLLVKTAGAGVSDLSTVFVANSGDIRVMSGAIRLPANFVNQGQLSGTGHFELAGTLTNDGHLAPGASPGTLVIDSHLAMTAASTLDIELQDATHHDLLQVNGNIALGGALALSCYSACHFGLGTDLLIVDGTGVLTGSFDSVSLAGFAPGTFSVHVDSANADVWLHLDQAVAAVPEPQTWALWLAGIGAMLLKARRRPATQGR
jgi:fibronectin-binding autotransporter adhesin